MKESRYNVWVDRGGAWTVRNLRSGMALDLPAAGLDAGVLRAMVDARMLVPDGADELAVLAERHCRSRCDTTAMQLTVAPTLGCNFACGYCFERSRPPGVMDATVQRRLLRLVEARLPTLRTLHITWYGGEPLLGRRVLLRLSDAVLASTAAAGVGYSAAIITNGWLLTARVAAQLRDRAVRDAQVTLDGPAAVHDARRPLAGGRGSFARVLANLVAVADLLAVTVRVNLDAGSVAGAEPLLAALAGAGLAGRVAVSPARVTVTGAPAGGCLPVPAFAAVEAEFRAAARRCGFAVPDRPGPATGPCQALREHDLVVGPRGELYKCPETVGDPGEVVGDLATWPNATGRLRRWQRYQPLEDPECRACPVLPACMGGCAHHATSGAPRDWRCSTLRYDAGWLGDDAGRGAGG